MYTHLRQIVWSLQVLWGHKGIAWPPDRLRLWTKSVRLYLSFLAFTDFLRPVAQLHRAMVCAVLSAVYDYDTDWSTGRRDGENFRTLLNAHVASPEAKQLALQLFQRDIGNRLVDDGLERGGAALRFYALVINSEWLRRYTAEELMAFGRALQIVDDLLDLPHDYLTGDANCMLVVERAPQHAAEACAFLESRFFHRLVIRSRVYRVIGKAARAALDRFGDRMTLAQLWRTGRPVTAGAFGGLLPFVGFAFAGGVPMVLQVTTATALCMITMAIMVFNDWKDRHHDRAKGKWFAYFHADEVWRYFVLLSIGAGALLCLVATADGPTALWCAGIWAVGVGYSFVPHWYVWQNVIVATCASATVLCGSVYARELDAESLMTFFLFQGVVALGEVYKDLEDMVIDLGYKCTIPSENGYIPTVGLLSAGMALPTFFMVIHPNPGVHAIAFVGMPILAFMHGAMAFARTRIVTVRRIFECIVAALLLVLLAT